MNRSVMDTVRHLWRHVGLDDSFLKSLALRGDPDTVIPSSFKVGHLAQASTALAGLAASSFYAARNGNKEAPTVTVDARQALLNFVTEGYTLIDGEVPKDVWDDLAGLYPTRDGHVRIHTNFPHHRQGIITLLQCEGTRPAVGEALLQQDSEDFETRATNAGMCVAAVRSFQKWDSHPQSRAFKDKLPIELIKIADSPPHPRVGALRPLEGIRILELTRVIAGPVAGRTLAHHGADVLWITSPNLPSLPVLDIDTSRGKRAAQLDLDRPGSKDKLLDLVRSSDVFLQSYRPEALENRGFGAADLAQVKPGIVVANLRGYGWDGPWAGKRAFDSLVQAATGINIAEGEAWARFKGESPATTPIRTLPLQALDHAAGELLAFGVLAALCKTHTEGGSWEVRVSLAGVGQWLRDLGQLPPELAFQGQPFPPRTVPVAKEISEHIEEWKVRDGKGGIKEFGGNQAPRSLMASKNAVELTDVPSNEAQQVGCPQPWSRPHRDSSSSMPKKDKRAIEQTIITRYFPVGKIAPLTSNKPSDECIGNAISILDLPDELLLLILDNTRISFESLECPVLQFQPSKPETRPEALPVDPAWRLYQVCKRFHRVFADVAYERVQCIGTTSLYQLRTSLRKQIFPAEVVEELHLRFKRQNEINFQAVKEQLVPFVRRLPNLKVVSLYNVVLNVELIQALGRLESLASLIYQVAYPLDRLEGNERYGTFSAQSLRGRPHLIPSKLRSMHVQFTCADDCFTGLDLLTEMLKASSKTITTLVIDLSDLSIGQTFGTENILAIAFPNLERFAMYHIDGHTRDLDIFYRAHSARLKEARVLVQCEDYHYDTDETDSNGPDYGDTLQLEFLPGLEGLETQFTWWHMTGSEVYLEIDLDRRLTAKEISLLEGDWKMLGLIGKRHPYLTVINIWDAAPMEGNSIFEELSTVASRLKHLEVFRFNIPSEGQDIFGLGSGPPKHLCDTEEPNEWCNCAGCAQSVYTSSARHALREEWEEVGWQPYEEFARYLADLFPRLRLVEWFLMDDIRRCREFCVPFWEFRILRGTSKITRTANTYTIERKLRNWHFTHPFMILEPWTPRRGIQYADDGSYNDGITMPNA